MTVSSTATRTARYERRMLAAGFVKKHVGVPEEQAGRLEEIAAETRDRIIWKIVREEIATPRAACVRQLKP